MRKLFRIVNGLMGALFVFGAVVQYNDPDPLRWMAIYLAAAAPCLLAAAGRLRWSVPLLVGLVAGVWAGTYAVHGAWSLPVGEMFAQWEMKNQPVEEEREMFGLVIIAAWMLLLTLAAWSGRKKPRTG